MTTNKETEFSCVDCHVQKCEKRPDRSGSREGFPQFCVTPEIRGDQKKELLKIYSEAKNAQIMKAAAEVEFEGSGQLTRVQEIMEFARKIGALKQSSQDRFAFSSLLQSGHRPARAGCS